MTDFLRTQHILLQVLIDDNEENYIAQDGYQLIAPGAKLAVKSTWLLSALASVRRQRKSTLKKKFDINAAIIKHLIDAFYTPYQLCVEGGSSMFTEDKIYNGLQCK